MTREQIIEIGTRALCNAAVPCEVCRAEVTKVLTALEAAGVKHIEREPSEFMLISGGRSLLFMDEETPETNATTAFKAMWDASPSLTEGDAPNLSVGGCYVGGGQDAAAAIHAVEDDES